MGSNRTHATGPGRGGAGAAAPSSTWSCSWVARMPVTPLIRGRGPRPRDASGAGHPRPDGATATVPDGAVRRRDRPRAPRWTRTRTAAMPVRPTHYQGEGFRAGPKRGDATGG